MADPSVHISADGLEARIVIPDGVAEADVRLDSLEAILLGADVQMSAEVRDRLESLIETWSSSPGMVDAVVAEGVPAEDGIDGAIELNEDLAVDLPAEPGSEDNVDFYDRASFRQVEADQQIGRVIECTEGVDGCTVRGENIAARPGRRCRTEIDSSIRVTGDELFATMSGVLMVQPECLSISNLLEVEDCVDFSTGNINFDGAVSVRNGVRDRFVVNATGDVSVGGLIEGSTIIVGGSLHCECGMAAKERGQMLVDGDCAIGYMNNVRGRIRGNLAVRRELMECELVVGGDVVAPGAALVGGHAVVTGSVELGTLGSEGGTPTMLTLGEVPMVARRLHQLDVIEADCHSTLADSEAKIESIRDAKANLTLAEREKLTECEFLITESRSRLDAIEQKRDELIGELRTLRRVELVVHREIHEKVTIRIAGRPYLITEQIDGPVSLRLDRSGSPVFRIGSGAERPLTSAARLAA